MARYATIDDVQARIPLPLLTIDPSTQPSSSVVNDWLDADSLWVDQALRWKYVVPVTADADITILRQVLADLVASRCWQLLSAHGGELSSPAVELRRQALQSLAYDAKSGRAMLVLPGTAEADTGEAMTGQAVHSFTDPDTDEDATPRFFSVDMEL